MLKNLVCHLRKLVSGVLFRREQTASLRIDKPYAKEGEVVTCENGHSICEFVETVYVGDMQNPEQLGFWHQPEPETGQLPIPRCSRCNGRFYYGGLFHMKDGWRDPLGLIEQFGPMED